MVLVYKSSFLKSQTKDCHSLQKCRYLQHTPFRKVAGRALIFTLLPFFPLQYTAFQTIQCESRHPSQYVILRKTDSSHL